MPSSGGGEYAIGLGKDLARNTVIGNNATSWAYVSNGNKRTSSVNSSYGSSYTTGDVLGAAFDADNGTLTFYKNGVSQGTAATGIFSGPYFFLVGTYNGTSSRSANFGQRPFAYAAPSGFKALCDTNLPAPVVAKPSTVMDVKLYTGNGSTNSITGLGFSPDLVWLKSRSQNSSHCLLDTVRGRAGTLNSNDTAAEYTASPSDRDLVSFDSAGFTLGQNYNNVTNTASSTYAAWTWDAGTSTVTNTQGSINSTVSVRANPSAGFSIVGYSGASGGGSWGHGLNAEPIFIIFKRRNAAQNWFVFHKTSGSWRVFEGLNNTNADSNYSGSMSASSTVVSLPSIAEFTTDPSSNYIAYCWAPVAGYSAMGSYTGNGNSSGPFVYLGFRPAFIMVKRTDASANWVIWDNKRDGYNTNNDQLYPNLSNAEDDGAFLFCDQLSNGFRVLNTSAERNASGGTYIYFAVAESPFQYARAR